MHLWSIEDLRLLFLETAEQACESDHQALAEKGGIWRNLHVLLKFL